MRVTFRATFQGRKGLLDTGAFKFPHPPVEAIEIYRRVDKWFARVGKVDIPQLGSEPSHGSMKDTVAASFQKQVSKWEMFDSDGHPVDPARVSEDEKGNFTQLPDSHIAAEVQAGISEKNAYKTECGAIVKVTAIKSKRGSVPPTCQVCRRLWDIMKAKEKTA